MVKEKEDEKKEGSSDVLELRLKNIWKEKKYGILDTVQKATPKKQGDKKNGVDVLELADSINLSPQETQQLLRVAIQELNANIYVTDNRVYAHRTPSITRGTHDDLFPLKEIAVTGISGTMNGLRFGVVSDTHFGSPRTNVPVLRAAYKYFEEQGITDVIHAGNILAGNASRQYPHDRVTVALDGQLELLQKNYPNHPKITTHYILGQKDRDFVNTKTDLIWEIEERMPENFKYIGMLRADIIFHPENKKPFMVRVSNEKQKYTFGVSYQPQKRVDSIAGGEKPNVWLSGGSEQVWESRYREVEILKLPGLQNQTTEMLDRGFQANVGFCVVSVVPLEKGVEVYAKKMINLSAGPSVQERGGPIGP
ncbi:hypothetical protein HYX13_05300 [Candidatus Woesearchaeota archaeon]|nr:hypothetical protein [Candidatus Woesearchaeota archaeon]